MAFPRGDQADSDRGAGAESALLGRGHPLAGVHSQEGPRPDTTPATPGGRSLLQSIGGFVRRRGDVDVSSPSRRRGAALRAGDTTKRAATIVRRSHQVPFSGMGQLRVRGAGSLVPSGVRQWCNHCAGAAFATATAAAAKSA